MFDQYGAPFISPGNRVLEIGPDRVPSSYQTRIKNTPEIWHTLEMESASDYTTYSSSNLYKYPIADSSYDIILAGQVMEHVSDLWKWLTELKRIIVQDGHLLLITPTSWPYHEAPVDCWRIYPEGMKSLAENVGMEIVLMEHDSLERKIISGLSNLKLIEGRSCFHDTTMQGLKKVNFYNGIVRRIPFLKNAQIATETAFDMVTVLRKRT